MSRNRSVASLTAALLSAASPAAFAQGSTDDEEGGVETILVTGVPTPIDEVGRAVSVITLEDILLRQNRTLFDALAFAPGVQSIRSGPPGAQSSLRVRGLPTAQTLVVQDGIVLNDPSAPQDSFNFANFELADVEKIEILRGAQSTLYGSDAIGGVVNVVTRSGAEGFGVSGLLEGGSFGTVRSSAEVRGGTERVSGRFTGAVVRTGGFSAADENAGNTERDGFRNVTVSGRGRAALMSNLDLEVIARHQDSTNEFDGFDPPTFTLTDQDNTGDTTETSAAAILNWRLFDDRFEQRLMGSFSRTARRAFGDDAPTFDGTGDRFSFDYRGTLTPIELVTFVYGVEYEEETADIRLQAFGGPTDGKIDSIAGYGLVQLRPISGVNLEVGVRHDANDGLNGVNETSDTTVSGSGSIRLPFVGTILRGSYSEGFRTPALNEIAQKPDLQSESSSGWDIGIEHALLRRPSIESILRVTYFDQQAENLIGFDFATSRPANIQSFDTNGVEVELTARLERLQASIAYTFTDAFDISGSVSNVVALQPDHRVAFDVNWTPIGRLRLGASVIYNGDEAFFGTEVDNFIRVDLRAAVDVTENVELFGRVENVTDAEYQNNPGFGTPGISGFGGLRVRL